MSVVYRMPARGGSSVHRLVGSISDFSPHPVVFVEEEGVSVVCESRIWLSARTEVRLLEGGEELGGRALVCAVDEVEDCLHHQYCGVAIGSQDSDSFFASRTTGCFGLFGSLVCGCAYTPQRSPPLPCPSPPPASPLFSFLFPPSHYFHLTPSAQRE